MILKTSKVFDVRFSEVDAMNVVWHGAYPLYFEDAREAFGAEFGLSYTDFIEHGCYAPLVDLSFHYRRPIRYGMRPVIDIVYQPTEAAKIVFDYEIRDTESGQVLAMGTSTQVFMDREYQLIWDNPPFYREWKERWRVFEND